MELSIALSEQTHICSSHALEPSALAGVFPLALSRPLALIKSVYYSSATSTLEKAPIYEQANMQRIRNAALTS